MRVALVIEDDTATRMALRAVLLRAGYGVCEGFSADLIPFTPGLDVIVSDVVTRPDVEVIRQWTQSLWDRLGVRVVLVTGRQEVVAAGADALGAADVIAKPFDVDDLVARVQRVALAREEPRAA